MTEKQLDEFLRMLSNVQNKLCDRVSECDHFSCDACIYGCYGDECAFDAVRDATIHLLEDIKNGRE